MDARVHQVRGAGFAELVESGPPTLVRPCLRRLYPLSNENADGGSIGNGGASAIGTITIHSGLVQPE